MSPDKAKNVSEKIREMLLTKEIPDGFTGKLIVNLQSGGVSGQGEIEITATGKIKL